MNFESDLPVNEVFKIFFSIYSIPKQNQGKYIFKYGTDLLNINDKTPLNNKIIRDPLNIYITKKEDDTSNNYSKEKNPGIKLKASIFIKNNEEKLMDMYAGTLQKISEFYEDLKKNLTNGYEIQEKLIINTDKFELIWKTYDNKTFSDEGIRSDFSCRIIPTSIVT